MYLIAGAIAIPLAILLAILLCLCASDNSNGRSVYYGAGVECAWADVVFPPLFHEKSLVNGPMTDRKNKRGDRGSIEEATNVAKPPNNKPNGDEEESDNMADGKEPDAASKEESTLYEIRDMWADLQKSVTSILKENSILREDIKQIKQLKSSLHSKEREVSVLKTSLEKVSKANESLKTKLQQTKGKLQKQVEEADNLYTALDDLEQYTRKNSLKIHGIPDDCYSSTEEVVLKLAAVLNVNVNPSDIEITHKLKQRGNNSSPVIVKFISHKVKTSLHKERVKLRNVKVSDVFPGYSNAVRAEEPRIFLNENLTNYKQGLVSRASEMKRDGPLKSFWTIDGKIFVKTSPSGDPVRIFSDYDLDDL